MPMSRLLRRKGQVVQALVQVAWAEAQPGRCIIATPITSPNGKLIRATANAVIRGATAQLTATVFGKTMSFLLDTGSEVSILSNRFTKSQILQKFPNFNLKTVSGSPVRVLGTLSASVSIKSLRRKYMHDFVVADVAYNVLGMDFLHFNNMSVNCRLYSLIDNITNLCVKCAISNVAGYSSAVLDFSMVGDSKLQQICLRFKEIFAPIAFKTVPVKHNIVHRVQVKGEPLHCRSRQLHPEKL
jgi:hypothetical protein